MPDANMFIEKRVHPRFTLKIPVKYQVIEDQTEIKTVHEHKTSHTLNVSLGGLYLVGNHKLHVGSILRLDVSLPGISRMIPAYAEVLWSNNTGGGLHFEVMEEEDLDILEIFLDKASSA